MTAWLISWEWSNERHKQEHPIVDVVSARKDSEYIRDYVQRLYGLRRLELFERVEAELYAGAYKPRVPADVHKTKSGELHVHCGTDPWLTAKLVRDLVIEFDPESGEQLSVNWKPHKE